MYKKTILSIAIASTLTLTGCLENSKTENDNDGAVTNPLSTSDIGTYPVFEPSASQFPIPNDLMFDSTASDGTLVDLGIPNPLPPYNAADYNPVYAAIGALSGASTSAPIDIKMSGMIDDDPVTLAQNVFLIALSYSSGDPLQGLLIQEPPAPASTQPIPGTDYTIEHKELDGTSYIRIHPVTPLEPLTRYVVVVKNGIQDIAGKSIVKSPGVAGYDTLTNPNQGLADPALGKVRALINGLWEPTAMAALSLSDDSNIALSYSFTTSGDEKVLNYIADPKQWFEDQINRFIGLSTAKGITGYVKLDDDGVTVLEDYRPGGAEYNSTLFAIGDKDSSGTIEAGEATATDISNAMAASTVPAFPLYLSAPAQAALAGLEAIFPAVGCNGVVANGTNGAAYITCLSASLAHPTLSPIGPLLPTPKAATIDFTGAVPVVHPNYANVSIVQGTMEVPYYSRPPADIGTGAAAGTNPGAGAPIKYLSWEADDTLAGAINATFASLGLVIPQADPNVTTAVNYVFPFPKKQDADVVTAGVQDMTIPIVVAYPTANAGSMKTMIMGHGLGGSRDIALGATGSGLVAAADVGSGVPAQDIAVVAIDQPLHGLKENGAVLTQTSNERHFGYAEAGSGLPPKALTPADNTSLLFINVESFLTTRDNNRQNVLDLLALRKAIGGIDLGGLSGAGTDLDGSDVYYQGYSLGTISAQAMLAVANDANQTDGGGTPITTDNFESAFFSTPGGGISRFLENSLAFGPKIVTGLANASLSSDMSSYQTFLNVIQAALDSFDAINFVGDYEAQGSKVLYYTASNDQVIPVSQVPGRTLYLPANATFAGQSEINASVSYLSGAEPLLAEANVTAIEAAGAAVEVDRSVIRFTPGAGSHGGPCPAAIADGAGVEFGGYAMGMLNPTGAGTFIGVSATAQTDWIDAAPIEDFFVDATQCAATP